MGSVFGGGSDVQAPDYSAQIQALKDAAATSASMGQFKPVTVTSSFGTPQYTYDASGRLTSAGYTAAPWLQALQTGQQGLSGTYLSAAQQAAANQQGLGAANQAFGGATSLYGAAQQALPTTYDTTQATQDYYNQMQALVAPEREQALARTRQGLFNTGRQGLAIGATQEGGQLATNPEMAAYYNAVAKQDATTALNARSQALADLQARTSMAQGLYGSGLQQGTGGGAIQNQQYQNWAASQVPLSSSLTNLGTMETMAQSPIALGFQYGAPVAQGQQYAGNLLYQGAAGGANLGVQQEQARVEAANANNQPGFWESLGGSLLTTGLTGGLSMGLNALPGLFSGAAGSSAALGGLTSSGAGLAGGVNTGGFTGGSYNPMQGFYTSPYSKVI